MKIKSCSYNKGIKLSSPIKKFSDISTIAVESPEKVFIPTRQIKGVDTSVVVTKGEEVKIGTKLAVYDKNAIVSSVSGIVEDIITMPSIFGGTNEVVVIKNNFLETRVELQKFDYSAVERNKLLGALDSLSIVDYDGRTLLDKISTANKDATLIVNFLTDEPYQTTNLVLVNDLSGDCVRGAEIMLSLLNSKSMIVCIPKDSKNLYGELINNLNTSLIEYDVTVCFVDNKYPVGDESQIERVLKKSKHKFNESGFVTVDAFSLCALKRLIEDGLTTDTRPITIIEKNENQISSTSAWVKLGTTLEEVASQLKVNGTENVRKLVAGGFFRGIAQGNENVGWIFNQRSIVLVMDKKEDCPKEISCITCGRCVKACPMGLIPYEIDNASQNRDFNQAMKYGAVDCSKCGCCSFVCPSKRFLAQRIAYAKEMILNKGLKNE